MSEDQAQDAQPIAETTVTNDAVENAQPETQTFPAEYVQQLRQEAADYRTKSKAMAAQIVEAWAAVDGRLLDPTDLPVSAVEIAEDGAISRQAVTAAIDALVKSKPHLAAQRPAPLPQGTRPEPEPVSLLRILNSRP